MSRSLLSRLRKEERLRRQAARRSALVALVGCKLSRPTESWLITENAVLRPQLIVLHRQVLQPPQLGLVYHEVYHLGIGTDVSGLHETLFFHLVESSSHLPPFLVDV
jgi:hypothetical protein